MLVDDVTMAGATPTRGTTVVDDVGRVRDARPAHRAALAELAARAVLEQHAGHRDRRDAARRAADRTIPGDADADVHRPARAAAARRRPTLLYDHLTDATGRACAGWDVATGAPIDDSDTLDAHTAAIRGLFAAYLATGDVRYRDRAIAVFERMRGRLLRRRRADLLGHAPAPVDDVEFTPLRFALLQSALRDMYELVATRPGGEALEPVLEERIARLEQARAQRLGRSRPRTASSTGRTSA